MTAEITATALGSLDLSRASLALGGNVFGWTAGRDASYAILDAFVGGGGVMIDTADVYSAWAEGNRGGESETVIGEWAASRGRRDDVIVATKASQHPEYPGLSADTVAAAARASLARLQTDRIDLYYAHFDDAATPLEETAAAFSRLVDEGLVREIGISNYSADRIDEWFSIADREGLHRPVALQPHYNLMERGFEGELRAAAERHGLGVLPYWALAKGFLTGKYRDGATVDSQRAAQAGEYLDDRGRRVLAALDAAAEANDVPVAAVALAWLRDQPTVVAPIASARTLEQLEPLLAGMTLELTAEELATLTKASA
ncbi:aldo/keto reductase [Demequina sp. SYSU T00192]|uniref:Aldo/keto reductase n=1 Tax=Demequina litoralis TaxID=3051660 RepID=A0ABT8G9R4_9MICO|nr:aldo/keto reductase [Demequina sp. SYSU T00192]MDN4475868.1 aldo/keto reductase [Demequina sp. SYSU T00192]